MNQEWLGGDLADGTGGGHKINILKKDLVKYKDDNHLLLMITDRYTIHDNCSDRVNFIL